jgi:hypothetical protein
MKIVRPLLIMRVDQLYPVTWYAGDNALGHPTVTKDRAYAWRFQRLDEARLIVESLKAEFGGVWSIVSEHIMM